MENVRSLSGKSKSITPDWLTLWEEFVSTWLISVFFVGGPIWWREYDVQRMWEAKFLNFASIFCNFIAKDFCTLKKKIYVKVPEKVILFDP